MNEYDKQKDVEAEGQRAAIWHQKPKCPTCGCIREHMPCLPGTNTIANCDDPFHQQFRERSSET